MGAALLLLLIVIVVAASCSIRQVDGAGNPHGEGSYPSAQTLHLLDGELPRSGPAAGAGLIDTYIDTDVLVAGGGSAGISAAVGAARNGANVGTYNI